jgi:glycine cleavage system aminomethyltransferase T
MLAALLARERDDGVVLRSALEPRFRAAGATFARRGGWLVPVAVPGEARRLARVAFADASSVTKLELRGGEVPPATADRHIVAVAPGRWIVLCRAEAAPELATGRRLVLDMTGAWAALVLAGPDAERLLRRLGPVAAIPGAAPLAGVPGRVLRRAGRLWALVATEHAQHVFDVCADLCGPLGGGPAGLDALAGGDPLLG